MAQSDRIYFLEAAKKKTFTRKEIEKTFGISRGTATNWSGMAGITEVKGTYPQQYAHKDYVAGAVSEEVSNRPIITLPDVPLDQLTSALNRIHDGDSVLPDFNKAIERAESVKDCLHIENNLISAILINRHNRKALED